MRRLVFSVLVLALGLPVAPPAAASQHDRLLLEPEEGTIFRIEGHYPSSGDVCPAKRRRPLLARYRGDLELRLSDSGRIQIINGLSFSHYLRGLAEVPLSWPMEALRAQVIAARSYAFATMRDEAQRAAARGYDICATDQCQVYRGATVELGAFGERWVDAVEATAGRVMTHGGGVIKAFYFSTSTGRTRAAFPGGTPLPWLDNVDAMDADAPLARWTAPVRLDDLPRLLAADGHWPAGRRIERVRRSGDQVVITGGGGTLRLSRSSFRSTLNGEGPCLFPERYPSRTGSQTGSRLPLTVPSSTYTLQQEERRLMIRGRGWGHDVGMSQYGARALAERGWAAPRILDHYYNHDRIASIEEPAEIRVLAGDGFRRVRITVEGEARVTTGTGSVLAPGNDFEVRTPQGRLRVFRGSGPELRSLTTVTPSVQRIESEPGQQVAIPFEASRAVRVHVQLAGEDGAVVVVTEQTSMESGDNEATLPLRDQAGLALRPGTYQATVIADDGLDEIRSEPVAIVVADPAPPPPAPGEEPAGTEGSRVPLVALAALAVVAAGSLAAATVRRRANRT